MARPPASEQVQVNFRMPADLKARIEAAAEANSRTTTAELVAALEEKYPAPAAPEFDYEDWQLRFARSKELLALMQAVVERMKDPESDVDALTEEFLDLQEEHEALFPSPPIQNALARPKAP